MSRKRHGKNGTLKQTTEKKIPKDKDQSCSAAKVKKIATTVGSQQKQTQTSPETKQTVPNVQAQEIVWREPKFDDVRQEIETESSSFLFKDAGTSPKSNICEAQINAMFETSVTTTGQYVQAVMSSTNNSRRSTLSVIDDKSSMSSFKSYNSLDDGYHITFHTSVKNSEAVRKSQHFRVESFGEYSANIVKEKTRSILELCENRTEPITMSPVTCSKSNIWPVVPQCCMLPQELDPHVKKEKEQLLEEIANLGQKIT